jgi:hypothetical protein
MLTISKLFIEASAPEGTIGGHVPPGFEAIQVAARSEFSTTYHVKRGGSLEFEFVLAAAEETHLDVGFKLFGRGMSGEGGALEEEVPWEGKKADGRYLGSEIVKGKLEFFDLLR